MASLVSSALSSSHCVLESLELPDCRLAAADVPSVAKAVLSSTSLRTLTLDDWAMPLGELRAAGVTEFAVRHEGLLVVHSPA